MTENEEFLTKQLITYLGNKRSLLGFIGSALQKVQHRIGKEKLDIFDAFSGSGITSRYFKQFANTLYVNDIEYYARIINSCYLANAEQLDITALKVQHNWLCNQLATQPLQRGLISTLYAPKDDTRIKEGERVFYTTRNAAYIDTARALIEQIPQEQKQFFLAPLLAKASVHANTSGVFKGFYKNPETNLGQFGGKNRDALERITGNIELPFPLFSSFSCKTHILSQDANEAAKNIPLVDVAYLDPPYNQHPYGSNYFMLNVIAKNEQSASMSRVSGIPTNWNRSAYNSAKTAYETLQDLVSSVQARFVLISFNSDGFIKRNDMENMLNKIGNLETLETQYNTFRGSRNLRNRDIHVKEFLYILEK